MDEKRRTRRGPLLWLAERSRRFWIIAAAWPIIYVASFGPACWISCRVQPSGHVVSALYRPVIFVWHRAPGPIRGVMTGFVTLGTKEGYPTHWTVVERRATSPHAGSG